jgi:HEPN domain-containing protein
MPGNDDVLAVAQEWTAKADNDLRSAEYLLKMEDRPTDTICFHAQQCVEKSLKALLVTQGMEVQKTHDLAKLMILLPSRLRPSLASDEQDKLTEYATVTRYPGDYEPISLSEARQAVRTARRVRREVGKMLESKPLFQ